MTYVKIGETLYSATISGLKNDRDWNDRESKTIKLEMTHAEAEKLFVHGLAWSIVMDVTNTIEQEDGTFIEETVQEEYDNSEYSIAGSITDNRDGTLAVKMGKPTQIETLESQITGTITEAELNNAYVEGVNSL